MKIFGDEHIQIVYIDDKFRGEIKKSALCKKKIKSVAKMRFETYLFRTLILYFCTEHKIDISPRIFFIYV